jgi:hypothetical protein
MDKRIAAIHAIVDRIAAEVLAAPYGKLTIDFGEVATLAQVTTYSTKQKVQHDEVTTYSGTNGILVET